MARLVRRSFLIRNLMRDGAWHTRDEILDVLRSEVPKEVLLKQAKHYTRKIRDNYDSYSEEQLIEYGVRDVLSDIAHQERLDKKVENKVTYYRAPSGRKEPSLDMVLLTVLQDGEWHTRQELQEVLRQYVKPEEAYRRVLAAPKFAKKLGRMQGEEAMKYALDVGLGLILSLHLTRFNLEREERVDPKWKGRDLPRRRVRLKKDLPPFRGHEERYARPRG